MSDKRILRKKIVNTRLLKSNGGWIYCNSCGKTVGYLCYTTYEYFLFKFVCDCGEQGSLEIGEQGILNNNSSSKELLLRKGRLFCPNDQSPLFSIVERNLKEYNYTIVCKNCMECFKAQTGP